MEFGHDVAPLNLAESGQNGPGQIDPRQNGTGQNGPSKNGPKPKPRQNGFKQILRHTLLVLRRLVDVLRLLHIGH